MSFVTQQREPPLGSRGEERSVMRKTLVLGSLALAFVVGGSVRAQETKDVGKPETTLDATQGFVTFKSGDNALTLGAWGQFRATFDDRDEFSADVDPTSSGFG